MSEKAQFDFDLFRLPKGKTEHEVRITEQFFTEMEQDLLENGKGKAFVQIDKSELLISFKLKVELEVHLYCDRTNKPFWHPLQLEQTLYYSFGEQEEEQDENYFVIERDRQYLDLAQSVLDFIVLALPAKRYHPDYEEPEEQNLDKEGNPLVFSSEGQAARPESKAEKEIQKKTPDPRWAALEKLKKAKSNGTS